MKKVTNFTHDLKTKEQKKAYFDPIRQELNDAIAAVLSKHGLKHTRLKNISYAFTDFHFTNKLEIQLVEGDILKGINLKNIEIIDASKTMWNPEHPMHADRVAKQVETMKKMLGHEYRDGHKTYKIERIEDEKWAKLVGRTRRGAVRTLSLEQVQGMEQIS